MNFLGWHIGPPNGTPGRYLHPRCNGGWTGPSGNAKRQSRYPGRGGKSCVGLISEPFLVARLSGPLKSLRTLYVACRDTQRLGNSVWAIDTANGVLSLQRAHKFKVTGASLDPETWEYELEIMAPDGVVKKRLPAPSVVHIRLPGNADSDWLGCAPWQNASLSADAMAEIETRGERRRPGDQWPGMAGPRCCQPRTGYGHGEHRKESEGGQLALWLKPRRQVGASQKPLPLREIGPAVKMGQEHTPRQRHNEGWRTSCPSCRLWRTGGILQSQCHGPRIA